MFSCSKKDAINIPVPAAVNKLYSCFFNANDVSFLRSFWPIFSIKGDSNDNKKEAVYHKGNL